MKKHRIQFTFSDESYNALKELAVLKQKSLADTIRDAIALEMFWQKETAKGGQFCVEYDRIIRKVVRAE